MRDLSLWLDEFGEVFDNVELITKLQRENEYLKSSVNYLQAEIHKRYEDITALEAQRNQLKESLEIHQERANC